MKALALIPSIGRSPYLPNLVDALIACEVQVLIIDNLPADQVLMSDNLPNVWDRCRYEWRPQWRGIYRQWNVGIRYGRLLGVPTLILNDDIVLDKEAINLMVATLKQDEWAILGFDYTSVGLRTKVEVEPVYGTYRVRGVGGFAFGVNPHRCARVDERFKWWGGDDDLVHATIAKGEKVGLLRGCPVVHPTPSLTANANGHLLPEGWMDNDRDLLMTKYGSAW